jgi:hypothetical protein
MAHVGGLYKDHMPLPRVSFCNTPAEFVVGAGGG